MEQIDLELGVFTLRSRSVPLRHSTSRLARGLEHGEQLVVRDVLTGSYYYAAVADVDLEPAETCYRLELGSRITSEEAAEWREPVPHELSRRLDDQVSARDLVELLAELRRGRRRLQELVDEAH